MNRLAVTLAILIAWPMLMLAACIAVTGGAVRALVETWE